MNGRIKSTVFVQINYLYLTSKPDQKKYLISKKKKKKKDFEVY